MKILIHYLNIILCAGLALNVFSQNPPSTVVSKPVMNNQIEPEGKYILNVKKEKNSNNLNLPIGKIEIVRFNDSNYKIKLRYVGAAPGKNMGIIDDQINIKNNKAIYQSKDDSTCRIEFSFSANSVKIVQQSTASAFACGFGRNVHIDGEYIKVKEKPASTSLPSIKPGKYGITLQWIGWEKCGVVNITDAKNGFYQIQGKQISDNGKDYLDIVGILHPTSSNEISFEGIIKSRVSFINQGKVCERKGKLTFVHVPGKKYWRLKEAKNCEGGMVVDYIDLYF
jgi:hypothetical protein